MADILQRDGLAIEILRELSYYPDHQASKVFDDLLGFRSLCNNYEDVMAL